MKENNKIRNSNIELLRIIAILFIILSHIGIFVTHNYLLINKTNYFISKTFTLLGEVGTNIFIIISSWFLIDSKIKTKKILVFFGEVWFYSILLLFISIFFDTNLLSVKNILYSIFPTIFGSYWFFTCYILLLFFSPFYNNIINRFEITKYKQLVFLLTLLLIIEGTIPQSLPNFFNGFVMFSFIYFCVGYIKKAPNLLVRFKINRLITITTIIFVIELFISLLIFVIGLLLDNSTIISNTSYFGKINSLFSFSIAINLFLIFIKIKPFYNNMINTISSTTLGVYLLHDNFMIKDILWNNLISLTIIKSPFFFPLSIAIIVIVFFTCSIIDLIRKNTFEKIYFVVIDKVYPILDLVIKKIKLAFFKLLDVIYF